MLNTQQFIDSWWQERYALGRTTSMTAWASDQLASITKVAMETDASKEWVTIRLQEIQSQLSVLTREEVKAASLRFAKFQAEVTDCGTVETELKSTKL